MLPCIGTDPVNATLWGYKSNNVHRFNILDGYEIKTRNFAAVLEMVASAKGSVHIANGASAFIPLSHYIISRKQRLKTRSQGLEILHSLQQPSLFRPNKARLIQP